MITLLSAALLASACGADPVYGPAGTSGQETAEGYLIYESPQVVVLVVDDAPTAEAAQVRDRAARTAARSAAPARSRCPPRASVTGPSDP